MSLENNRPTALGVHYRRIQVPFVLMLSAIFEEIQELGRRNEEPPVNAPTPSNLLSYLLRELLMGRGAAFYRSQYVI